MKAMRLQRQNSKSTDVENGGDLEGSSQERKKESALAKYRENKNKKKTKPPLKDSAQAAKARKRHTLSREGSDSDADIDPDVDIVKNFKSILELNDYCWGLFSQSNDARVLLKMKRGDPSGIDLVQRKAYKKWIKIIKRSALPVDYAAINAKNEERLARDGEDL